MNKFICINKFTTTLRYNYTLKVIKHKIYNISLDIKNNILIHYSKYSHMPITKKEFKKNFVTIELFREQRLNKILNEE